jgi:lipid A 3-O-deacylase
MQKGLQAPPQAAQLTFGQIVVKSLVRFTMNKFSTNWNRAAVAIAFCVTCAGRAESNCTPVTNTNTNAPTPSQPLVLSSERSFWVDGIGSGFRKGTHEVSLSGGYATGEPLFGTTANHKLALATINAGWVLSDVVMKHTPIQGNWEVLAEGFGGLQVNTPSAYMVGLDGFIRYNFITGTRLVPFLEGGVGGLDTDIRRPDLGSDFQFSEKVGLGAHYFITEHVAATAEVRFMHISKANIDTPNHGLNTFPILLGVSYYF